MLSAKWRQICVSIVNPLFAICPISVKSFMTGMDSSPCNVRIFLFREILLIYFSRTGTILQLCIALETSD